MPTRPLAPPRVFVLLPAALFAVLALAAAPSPARAFECAVTIDHSENEPGAITGAGSLWESDGTNGEFEEALLLDRSVGVSRYDALDGYGRGFVGGLGYENPDFNGCKRINDGQGLAFPTDVLGNIEVTPTIYADPRKPFGRQLVSFKNTSGTPTVADLKFDGDLGSDSNTKVAASSAGAVAVTPRDSWATSCEDGDDDGCANVKGELIRDPELAHNWQRRGSAEEKADVIVLANGASGFDVTFEDVEIEPGRTVSLMEVVSIHRRIGSANDTAAKIVKDPAGFGVFRGLSKTQRKRILNW
jgi:hypothetical protein